MAIESHFESHHYLEFGTAGRPIPYGYNLGRDLALFSQSPSHISITNPFPSDGENKVQCVTAVAKTLTLPGGVDTSQMKGVCSGVQSTYLPTMSVISASDWLLNVGK